MIDGRFTDKLARTSCSPETRPGRSLCLSDLKAQQPYLLRNGDPFCFDDATWNVQFVWLCKLPVEKMIIKCQNLSEIGHQSYVGSVYRKGNEYNDSFVLWRMVLYVIENGEAGYYDYSYEELKIVFFLAFIYLFNKYVSRTLYSLKNLSRRLAYQNSARKVS